MVLLMLAAIFFGPLLLGAKLLGASWLLAAFIACAFYPACVIVWIPIMVALDARDNRRRRKYAERLRVERGLPRKLPKRAKTRGRR